MDQRTPGALRRRYDRLEVVLVPAGDHVLGATACDHRDRPLVVVYAGPDAVRVASVDGAVELPAGALTVLRDVGELAVDAPAGGAVVLHLPHDTVAPHRHDLDAGIGRVLPTGAGSASLVAHLLDGLAAQLDHYRPAAPGRLAQHVIGFIAMMCADAGPSEPVVTRHRALLPAARAWIETHLDDPELRPELVAAEQGVSARTLHRLFELDGTTFSAWVRDRRLEHCRVEIEERAFDGTPVCEIGARWGLGDAAHFSRVFKARYGLPPKAYRDAARGRRDQPATVSA
jgi:AraC-like DNA-binding protein